MSDWQIPDGTDPRALHAPEVLAALQASCAAVRAASDPALLELARLRLADLLGVSVELGFGAPAWGEPGTAARGRARVVADLRRPSTTGRGRRWRSPSSSPSTSPAWPRARSARPRPSSSAGVLPFVQGVYLLDVGQRAAVALGALFATPVPSTVWAWPAARRYRPRTRWPASTS